MNQPRDFELPVGIRPDQCSPEEWQTRVELAAAYRLADRFGWSMLIFNHITARVPGKDDHFLINNFGLMYDEITASNLVKIDLDGNLVGDYVGRDAHEPRRLRHPQRHPRRPPRRAAA